MPTLSTYIWLASASPRRRQLLDQIGINYKQVIPAVAEEDFIADSSEELVLLLAAEKAKAARLELDQSELQSHPILAADTMVVRDGTALGKPVDRDHAITMLQSLSGRTHHVMTAIAVAGISSIQTKLVQTSVTFKAMSTKEINHYCDSGEPFDKAGGYGIQGKAGALITHIEGSYSAVVGLPLFETKELLAEFGVRE